MKWHAAVAGALASALVATAAFAEVHIVDDPGGEVSVYVRQFNELRKAGEHFVIDGPCLSACTLITGMLGFHAAFYFDDASQTLVPNREGTAVIMRLYPPEIREWIERHGGLKMQFMALRGEELSALYDTCPEESLGN